MLFNVFAQAFGALDLRNVGIIFDLNPKLLLFVKIYVAPYIL